MIGPKILKLYIFSFLFFGTSTIFCQTRSENINSIDLSYGSPCYQNSFSGIKSFAAGGGVLASQVGLFFHVQTAADRAGILSGPAFLGVQVILPSQSNYHDTLDLKMSGYSVFFPCMGKDFVKSDRIDINLIPSIVVGRMQAKGESILQRNGFFGGQLMMQQRVCIGRLVLSLYESYFLDISQKHWKKLLFGPGQNNFLDYNRWHHFYLGLSIGYRFV